MTIIEPHIHMYSRTTDDYQAMYAAGIRACVEPSFWLGSHRRHAGTFFDYFENILTFEPTRSERFGIDHFAAVAYNPKEAENKTLVDEVLAGIGAYLDHPRCVAMGEIGFNNLNEAEYYCFTRQLALAKERGLPVIIHISHNRKPECLDWVLRGFDEVKPDQRKIYLDHNTEDTIARALAQTDCRCGLTVYPISKLDPERASAIIKQHGAERIIVSGSADWGISDPVSLVKVIAQLRADGHSEDVVMKVAFDNANAFYSQSPNWKPRFDLTPWPIELRQP
ncbi:MAG: TatD family hydrolase [Kiritimatiellaeota bacterium]|nr:TatD family hydrolase [Kiritimatiellota bacterium]